MSLNIMESVTKLHKEKVVEDEKHRKVILEKLAYALTDKPLENDNKEKIVNYTTAAQLQ